MKVINIGEQYEIYGDGLRTFDRLPAGFYEVEFSQFKGFYLSKHQDIAVTEKIYGKHLAKVDKVMRAFTSTHRNLGVILSGKKGIGKSVFAKLLSVKAVEGDLPVILVNKFTPGIASYIESIEQECVVMFDEYDKTFGGVEKAEGQAGAQAEMLSLFDGMAQGKKLFVITCNELHRLSEYLVNRPGRFHYHIRFESPSEDEIREYLTDSLDAQYHGEIAKVVAFSKKIDLNYDCLRAIAFELNTGEPFETAIADMNIVNTDDARYNIFLNFAGGYKLNTKGEYLDLFDYEDDAEVNLYDEKGDYLATVAFSPADCTYDFRGVVVPAAALDIRFGKFSDNDHRKAKAEKLKAMKPECLLLKRVGDQRLHYAI